MDFTRHLKYLWFFIVMRVTWILPDWKPILRFRGLLASVAFAQCGKNFQIASNVTINFSSRMALGDHVYIAHGCWINAEGGVLLGDEVMLGPYTVIATSDHTKRNQSYRFGSAERSRVIIGKGSWTGSGVTITRGVSVGAGTCCAAGAVVTHDTPAGSIVGGVPARQLNSSGKA